MKNLLIALNLSVFFFLGDAEILRIIGDLLGLGDFG
jgi:hypothetical protein